ncbi:hypothetical protein HanXRQr2_Chr15g0714241 [Helianthus annuus]|uniref:Uncharacterized protein n=1 Tax=Helianthus annuus TaxID=4232 RepID=A0A9K3E5B0_HELAN|nr:hypothetical protein HanXRQr2_Chr15g0714241 [Helianthus annuus]
MGLTPPNQAQVIVISAGISSLPKTPTVDADLIIINPKNHKLSKNPY